MTHMSKAMLCHPGPRWCPVLCGRSWWIGIEYVLLLLLNRICVIQLINIILIINIIRKTYINSIKQGRKYNFMIFIHQESTISFDTARRLHAPLFAVHRAHSGMMTGCPRKPREQKQAEEQHTRWMSQCYTTTMGVPSGYSTRLWYRWPIYRLYYINDGFLLTWWLSSSVH